MEIKATTRIYSAATVPQVAPTKRLQWEEAQNCWVILYPEGMIKLNSSSAEIMKRIDGKRSIAEIIADLKKAYPGVELDNDVYAFMEVAHEQQWIRPKPAQ
ncbi:MAG TPA: pyrroloquinoline quinone biosynthesis peptide chaperone PqqD [Gammaproteobacteria bacterium]|nr:pyrroloquinoline quinone biosynthesis peptide chaperone PqqD [Gammaproteobacteria bacterium]